VHHLSHQHHRLSAAVCTTRNTLHTRLFIVQGVSFARATFVVTLRDGATQPITTCSRQESAALEGTTRVPQSNKVQWRPFSCFAACCPTHHHTSTAIAAELSAPSLSTANSAVHRVRSPSLLPPVGNVRFHDHDRDDDITLVLTILHSSSTTYSNTPTTRRSTPPLHHMVYD
jgi:hypothetical protein